MRMHVIIQSLFYAPFGKAFLHITRGDTLAQFRQKKRVVFATKQVAQIKPVLNPRHSVATNRQAALFAAFPHNPHFTIKEEEKERVETAKRETEKTATEQDNMADKHPTESGETQGKRNENGWGDLFGTFGLDGLDDIGQNLGYVISMLPDILFGLFTGKSKSLLPQNNLLPIASILTGMYVRNPMLKMVLIGMGGVNLLNKAGHEALGRQGNKVVQPYKVYADEPLNPRIANPVLQGNSLIAVIDKVPCSIQLTDNVVDAHRSGALPLNTLANAVLAKHDEMQQMAQQNYRAAEAERDEGRERTILLK